MKRILDIFLCNILIFFALCAIAFPNNWKFETEPTPWITQAGNVADGRGFMFEKENEKVVVEVKNGEWIAD